MKIAIGVIVAVLLAGGVWYVTSESKQEQSATTTYSAEQTEQPDVVAEKEQQSFAGSASLDTLFLRGEQLKCDFRAENETGLTTGTFYTDGDRFRTLAVHTYEGVTTETEMINDGEFMYVWGQTAEGSMAIKMRTPETQATDTVDSTQSGSQEYIDFEEQVSYDCERWNVDAALFVPPATVEFTDMAAMMQEALQGMPEGFELPEGIQLQLE